MPSDIFLSFILLSDILPLSDFPSFILLSDIFPSDILPVSDFPSFILPSDIFLSFIFPPDVCEVLDSSEGLSPEPSLPQAARPRPAARTTAARAEERKVLRATMGLLCLMGRRFLPLAQ